MVQPICRDMILLARKAEAATAEDASLCRDLADTLLAHREHCVGMAANMIGACKRIIAFFDQNTIVVMVNPDIFSRSGPYEAEEGCLSLDGIRKTQRFRTIRVRYQDERMRTHTRTFSGMTAQIIQHEVDHCEGILI